MSALKSHLVFTLLLVAAVLPAAGRACLAGDTIYVKIVVDEEDTRRPEVWQAELTERLSAASDIIEPYTGLRFEAQSFDTWQSDDRLSADFAASYDEFVQEVSPAPAQIAIGFSSQHHFLPGRTSLGGTRGPMNPHIMLRDNAPNVTEIEKIEALVHELGHYLGAAHSSDQTSVMRTVLGDGRARRNNWQIQFDAANAAVIRMVAGEIDTSRVRSFAQLSDSTKAALQRRYESLETDLPEDPVAQRYLRYLSAAEIEDR